MSDEIENNREKTTDDRCDEFTLIIRATRNH